MILDPMQTLPPCSLFNMYMSEYLMSLFDAIIESVLNMPSFQTWLMNFETVERLFLHHVRSLVEMYERLGLSCYRGSLEHL